jgi:hypothetical protein
VPPELAPAVARLMRAGWLEHMRRDGVSPYMPPAFASPPRGARRPRSRGRRPIAGEQYVPAKSARAIEARSVGPFAPGGISPYQERRGPDATAAAGRAYLGGPCDHQHQGQTADEVIKAQDRHLKEMVAGGDTAHAPALKEMKGRWKHPISGMGWYRAAERNFAAIPED